MSRFKAPMEYRRTTEGRESGSLSRFAGMPVGVQLFSDWHVFYQPFTKTADLPDETNDWTATETGAGGTRALSDDLSPPHLIITTDALDNDSVEMQFTAAGGGGEAWVLTGDRPLYFEAMIRFRDAGNVDAAVEQVDWFIGLAVTDTTVIDGATDFVGFVKQDLDSDATQAIRFVCADGGGGGGALVDGLVQATGWTSLNPVETQATDRNSRTLGANQWIKLAFLIEPHNSGAAGDAFCWVNDEPIPGNPINLAGQVPDTEITVTFAVQNGEAVVKIMDVAYFLVAQSYRDDAGALV